MSGLQAMPVTDCGQALPGECRVCFKPVTGRKKFYCSNEHRDAWYVNHRWTDAREECMRRADRRCYRCHGSATEVDHIKPRKGRPMSPPSCMHHQTNLRALCHECHRTRWVWWDDQPSALWIDLAMRAHR